jgi:hypothetical protein
VVTEDRSVTDHDKVTTSEREAIPLTTEAELGVKFGSQVIENAETRVAGN